MSALRIVFGILASLVGLYNFLCLIRIALTWIPNVSSSKVSQFLAKICDPYLNIFRGIRGLRLGSFDFSPAIGLLLLALAANVLDSLSHGAKYSLSSLLVILVNGLWTVISSIIGFLILLIVIRLVIMLVKKTQYSSNPLVYSVDQSIAPFVDKLVRPFIGKSNPSYKTSLIVAAIVLFVLQSVIFMAFFFLTKTLSYIPF